MQFVKSVSIRLLLALKQSSVTRHHLTSMWKTMTHRQQAAALKLKASRRLPEKLLNMKQSRRMSCSSRRSQLDSDRLRMRSQKWRSQMLAGSW